jgi:Na+/phosphate symporter
LEAVPGCKSISGGTGHFLYFIQCHRVRSCFVIDEPFYSAGCQDCEENQKEEGKLFFIDTGINSADLSLPVAMQEIVQQCQRVKQLNMILNRIINFTTEAEFHEQIRYVKEYFNILQENQKAINHYLIGMVEDKSSLVTSKQIKSLLNINLLLEHIRMKYESIYRLLGEKRQQRIWFGPTQRSTLLHRINDAAMMLKRVIQILQSNTFIKAVSRGLTLDQSEKNQDYLDYEKELMVELERGEMKLSSVVTYYRHGTIDGQHQ